DEVFYEITAVSRPNLFLTRLAYPYVRLLQKRFWRQSLQKIHALTVEEESVL
ncbi:MAG TPA: DUF1990 domain-containing protein, partial [Deltaproteobacteria bacterium]|nr:DUF1990 domain-containing protein [Deltaproteobacteria bacterium]